MTPHEIVALRCPSCGGGASQPSREMAFGAEFRCEHCGVTSVLIIDRALVPSSDLQKQGEKVCTTCGRVALRDARFCQAGHPLIRKCVNRECHKEFAVDHQRCDYCGWLQQVKPDTVEGAALVMERAITDLSDSDPNVVVTALMRIQADGPAARAAAGTAVPTILRVIESPPVPQTGTFENSLSSALCPGSQIWCLAYRTLAALGPSASAAVPALQKRIEESWSNDWEVHHLLECLAPISPDRALAYCSRILEKRRSVGLRALSAVHIAYLCGKTAIPVLQKFSSSGFLDIDQWGINDTIKALREDRKIPYPAALYSLLKAANTRQLKGAI